MVEWYHPSGSSQFIFPEAWSRKRVNLKDWEDRLEADLKIFVCMFPDKQPLLYVGGPVVRKALDASRFADSVAEVADDNPGEEPQIRELTIAGIPCLTLFCAHPSQGSSPPPIFIAYIIYIYI